jgi:hypothetical protein
MIPGWTPLLDRLPATGTRKMQEARSSSPARTRAPAPASSIIDVFLRMLEPATCQEAGWIAQSGRAH